MPPPAPSSPRRLLPPPAPGFAAECEAHGVDAADREPLEALLARWGRPEQPEPERRAQLLRDYGHWRLYQRSREGDESAAREFESYWRRYIGAFLRGRYPPDQVDEIAAAFFARVYRLIGARRRWDCPFVPYLRMLLVNLSRDEGRRLGQRRQRERSLDDGDETVARQLASPLPTPERRLLEAERREALARALEQLGPTDLYILRQAVLAERPGPELAQELGIALPALWKRVERAKKRLRALLAAAGSGQDAAPARSGVIEPVRGQAGTGPAGRRRK